MCVCERERERKTKFEIETMSERGRDTDRNSKNVYCFRLTPNTVPFPRTAAVR